MSTPELYGLVLGGGKSKRMGKDKSILNYHGQEQRIHLYKMLNSICEKTYISCNKEQRKSIPKNVEFVVDIQSEIGPLGGIYSAFKKNKKVAWLVVPIDLPLLEIENLKNLVKNRKADKYATCFFSDRLEPLLSIWEPKTYPILKKAIKEEKYSPRKIMKNLDLEILHLKEDVEFLKNVNSPDQVPDAFKFSVY